MPTYGYKCISCNHTFEVMQKVSDKPISSCEECGGPVKKLLFPVGIVFKGSGFHVNDYPSRAGTEAKPAKSKEKAKSTPESPAATADTAAKE